MKSARLESVARYLLPLRGGGVLCGLLVLAIAAPAWGGMSGLAAAAVAAVPAAADVDESTLASDDPLPLLDPATLRFPDVTSIVGVACPAEASADSESAVPGVVHQLPPPPGSARIVLSFLLPLGAWGAIRSARHANLAVVPEWYHASAPERVNHATAFELDFPQLTLHWVATCADTAFAPVPVTNVHRGRDVPRLRAQQHVLRLASPRGPPVPGQPRS